MRHRDYECVGARCECTPTRRLFAANVGYYRSWDRADTILWTLLPSFDLFEHLSPDFLSISRLQLLLLYFANVGVVDSTPHDLQLIDIFDFLLLLSEGFDMSHDLRTKLDELLRGLQLLVCVLFCEVTELSLLYVDQLVYLVRPLPEITQVCTFRFQPRVQALCIEKLLAADKTCEELKSCSVANIELLPHVEDVV